MKINVIIKAKRKADRQLALEVDEKKVEKISFLWGRLLVVAEKDGEGYARVRIDDDYGGHQHHMRYG